MKRLPLFPLPLVLLPESPLPLHIFEMRYRRMIARCRETGSPFGLLYHDPDEHGPFMSEEGRVGTEATIEVFHPLPDGRSVILVRGGERFSIREEVESEEPFYEALVQRYDDAPVAMPGATLRERRRRSAALLHSAVRAMGGEAGEVPELDFASETSFKVARCLQIAPAWLQALLELRDESERLDRLDAVFRSVLTGQGPKGAEEGEGSSKG